MCRAVAAGKCHSTEGEEAPTGGLCELLGAGAAPLWLNMFMKSW